MNVIAGTVVAVAPGRVSVRVVAEPGCGGCVGGGCGLGPILSLLVRNTPQVFEIDTNDSNGFRVGQRLDVGLPGASLALLGILAYGLPLAGLIGGALVGASIAAGAGDLASLAGAGGGAAAAWLWQRRGGFDRLAGGALRIIA